MRLMILNDINESVRCFDSDTALELTDDELGQIFREMIESSKEETVKQF